MRCGPRRANLVGSSAAVAKAKTKAEAEARARYNPTALVAGVEIASVDSFQVRGRLPARVQSDVLARTAGRPPARRTAGPYRKRDSPS